MRLVVLYAFFHPIGHIHSEVLRSDNAGQSLHIHHLSFGNWPQKAFHTKITSLIVIFALCNEYKLAYQATVMRGQHEKGHCDYTDVGILYTKYVNINLFHLLWFAQNRVADKTGSTVLYSLFFLSVRLNLYYIYISLRKDACFSYWTPKSLERNIYSERYTSHWFTMIFYMMLNLSVSFPHIQLNLVFYSMFLLAKNCSNKIIILHSIYI